MRFPFGGKGIYSGTRVQRDLPRQIRDISPLLFPFPSLATIGGPTKSDLLPSFGAGFELWTPFFLIRFELEAVQRSLRQ